MKKKIILNSILIIGIFIFVYYTFSLITERRELLSKNYNFAIGKVTSFEVGAKVSPWLAYEFEVNSKRYYGTYSIDYNKIKNPNTYVNKYFLVKYSTVKPKYNEINLNSPITNKGNRISLDTTPPLPHE